MKKYGSFIFLLFFSVVAYAQQPPVIQLAVGSLEGVWQDSLQVFKGVPYARPPLGELRWKEPQPLRPWKGIRKADHFGFRAMQRPIYRDMVFRSEKPDEDCLYLNVWTRSASLKARMPVLVYFHGGGLSAGDGSEWRYDGADMARRGIVVVTINYRLGIFGFLAHPSLSRESPHHVSGNYGFLDQRAALLWVKQNISRFGGDPEKVTIAGQSAGSVSVSAHMASPLSRGLFRYAIGESGSIVASLAPASLRQGEENGLKFAGVAGVASLEEMRQLPADKLLELAANPDAPPFPPLVDGYFLPQSPRKIFATGLQADVPLLAGWTSAEVSYHHLFGKEKISVDPYKARVRELYGSRAEEILKFYPAATDSQLLQSATDLASDRFTAYSTWKWMDLHAKTGGSTVYRYLFAQKLPPFADTSGNKAEPPLGAPHSADIEYALGNLAHNKVYAWTKTDDSVSFLMQSYFVNFIRTGNPNGEGLPPWPGLQSSIPKVMIFSNATRAEGEKNLKRYVFLDQFYDQ